MVVQQLVYDSLRSGLPENVGEVAEDDALPF